ncbi:MAG: hypothetical protein LBM75_09385 [Myxococcales bacterium]|jgi:hypothetical protein|nr:hypothetical protein [Myxococcales bacterium]
MKKHVYPGGWVRHESGIYTHPILDPFVGLRVACRVLTVPAAGHRGLYALLGECRVRLWYVTSLDANQTHLDDWQRARLRVVRDGTDREVAP